MEEYYLANNNYTDQWNKLTVNIPGNVSGNLLSVEGRYKLSLTLISQTTPDGITATDERLPGVRLYFGHLHTTYGTWAGKRNCYASTAYAHELCRNVTGQKMPTASDHIYEFR